MTNEKNKEEETLKGPQEVPGEQAEQPKETPQEEKRVLPKTRRIIIETDGNGARITNAEVAGSLELKAILEALLNELKK